MKSLKRKFKAHLSKVLQDLNTANVTINDKSNEISKMKVDHEREIHEYQTKLVKEKKLRAAIVNKYKEEEEEKQKQLLKKLKNEEEMSKTTSSEISLLIKQLDESTERNDKKANEILTLKEMINQLNNRNNELKTKIKDLTNEMEKNKNSQSKIERDGSSDSIKELLNSTENDQSNKKQINDQKEQYGDLDFENHCYKDVNEVNYLKKLLSEKEKLIQEKNKIILRRDNLISEKNKQIISFENENKQLKDNLIETTKSLKNKIQNLKDNLIILDSQLVVSNNDKSKLQDQVDTLNKQINLLRSKPYNSKKSPTKQ